MKKGELYEVRHTWLLPRDSEKFWKNCGPVLYLGEDVILRSDGITVTNHVVLAAGTQRILDQSFLKYLEPLK
jgi:hypothetical protein